MEVLLLSELERFYIEQNFERDNFNLIEEIDKILSEFIDENLKCYNYFKTGIMLLFEKKWRASSKTELFHEIARINEVKSGSTVSRTMRNYMLVLFGKKREFQSLEIDIEKYKLKFNKKPTEYYFIYQIYREIIAKNYKYFES